MSIEIRLDNPSAQSIAQTIRGGAEQNISAIRESLNSAAQTVEELKKTANQQELAADRLLKQYELAAGVARRAQDRFQNIQYKADRVRREWQEVARLAGQTNTHINTNLHQVTQLERQVEGLTAQLTEESVLNAQAEMLMGMVGFIDNRHPISINPVTQMIRWVTRDIYIKDGFGGVLPHSFGQYEVTVKRTTSGSGIARVEAVCSLMPGSRSSSEESHYPHPHISGTNPCLGNAADLLANAMAVSDYVRVVVVMTEFLTSYNFENPYIKLRDMGIPNRWEFPVCETEQHLMMDCTCDRCSGCGTIRKPETIMYDCGVCSTCCVRHHVHDPVAEEQKTGINGTGCTHRAVPRIQYRVQPQTNGGSHEGNGQEDAHVQQDRVGQDVGHDPAVQG